MYFYSLYFNIIRKLTINKGVTILATLSRLPRWLVVEINTLYIQTYRTVDVSIRYRVKCVDKLQDWISHYMAPGRLCTDNYVSMSHNCIFLMYRDYFRYSRTPCMRINWDGEPFGNAENSDNWSFLYRGYIVSLYFGCPIYSRQLRLKLSTMPHLKF